MRDREAAKRLIYQAQAAVTSVLVLGDVPPLRALYCPGYPKELLGEVIRDGEKNYMIALRITAWVNRPPQNPTTRKSCENKNKATEIQRISVDLVRPEGFEPPAFWSVARRSIQLS